MEDVPVCGECGYQLTGLVEGPGGEVRCPECGIVTDLVSAPRLRPWPRPAAMGWRLCGPMAVNLAALVVVVGVIGLVGVENVPRLPGALLVMSLFGFLLLTGVVHPYLAAVLLAEQHAVRPRRTVMFLRVFGAAVGINAVMFVIGMIALGAMGAW